MIKKVYVSDLLTKFTRRVVVNLENLEKRMLKKQRLLEEAQKEFPSFVKKQSESDPKFPLKLNGTNPQVKAITILHCVNENCGQSAEGAIIIKTRKNTFSALFGCCHSNDKYCCFAMDVPRNLHIFIREFLKFFFLDFLKRQEIKIDDWNDLGWPYPRK